MLRILPRVRDLADVATGPGRRERRRANRRLTFAPEIDRLEIRITPAVVTWTGLGADDNWTTAANWDVAPAANDDLVFPDIADSARHTAVNDFAAGTPFGSIRIGEAGYTLSGNALSEPGGLFADYGTGSSTINIATTLSSSFPNTVSVQAGGTLVLGGALSGANGISKVGAGLALFTQANTYTGLTDVNAGTLAIANSSALGSSASGNGTNVVSGASLEIRGTINTSETVGIAGTGFNGVGSLFNGTGNNVVQNVNLTADATIGVNTGTFLLIPSTLGQSGGTGFNLTKAGSGVLDVLATKTYTGSTTVAAGTLAVEGTVGGPIAVNEGATLSGAGGNLGDVVSTGGSVNPGFSTSPFTSNVVSLTLDAASTFVVMLNGNTPGNGTTGYNQINSSTSSLGGATLSLTIGGGYTPAPGDSLSIITNSGAISGTFNGLPEGGYVSLGAGRTFKITYAGGSGSNVVLAYVDDTATTLASSANPSSPGQSVTLTATVAPVLVGGPTPTGTVTFKDGATTLGTGTLAGGVATFATSALTVGSHSITAVYSGDAATAPSTSALLTQVVSTVATGTTLTASPSPSVFGQSVSFTATVDTDPTGGATPTGTVDFFDGVVLIADDVALVGGVAAFSTTTLTVGSHSITAVYSGDATDATSTSAILVKDVSTASTTTTIAGSSVNPSAFGQSVTFTASVSVVAPGVGTPTGSIRFFDGATLLGSGTIDAGIATYSTSDLAPGSHSITAIYEGDANFVASGSDTLTRVVERLASEGTLTTSTASTVFGQATTLTATFTESAPGSGVPTGEAVFFDGESVIGSAPLSGGVATLSVAGLEVGTHSLRVLYAGDASFDGSTSAPVVQSVARAGTTSTIVSSDGSSALGQSVTFTATVTATAPGVGTPGGSVVFFDGETAIGFVLLDGSGTATLQTSGLSAGSHAITARYSGDGRYVDGVSPAAALTVETAPVPGNAASTTTLTLSQGIATFSQTLTFTAVVSADGGVSTGTVTFRDGNTVLAVVPVDNGSARLATSALRVGTHSITATYSGNADLLGSTSAAVSETIVNASTFIAVTSSTPSAVAGETVTYSATIGVFAPGSGVPTGLMAFYDGSTLLGVVPLSGGVAQLGVTAGDPGQAHNIIAVYVGDGQYGQSSSPILSQSVVKADATATFTFQATAGRVVFTATVASTSTGVGIPGGTVTFFVNGRAVATRTLDAGSAASVVLPRRAVLNRRVTVRYNGDASFNSAQSPTVVVTRGGLIAPSTPVGTFRARLAAQVARASRAIGLG